MSSQTPKIEHGVYVDSCENFVYKTPKNIMLTALTKWFQKAHKFSWAQMQIEKLPGTEHKGSRKRWSRAFLTENNYFADHPMDFM